VTLDELERITLQTRDDKATVLHQLLIREGAHPQDIANNPTEAAKLDLLTQLEEVNRLRVQAWAKFRRYPGDLYRYKPPAARRADRQRVANGEKLSIRPLGPR
jgi:hypothetical protein